MERHVDASIASLRTKVSSLVTEVSILDDAGTRFHHPVGTVRLRWFTAAHMWSAMETNRVSWTQTPMKLAVWC